jgi:membrane peptidoglycan carboxypeptidase
VTAKLGVVPAGAVFTNLFGDKEYLVGGSTLTQQIIKNTFLTPAKTMRRKIQEQFMALVLERRLSKDQILELYLNDVTLGQRGPFEIHGVAEAARILESIVIDDGASEWSAPSVRVQKVVNPFAAG